MKKRPNQKQLTKLSRQIDTLVEKSTLDICRKTKAPIDLVAISLVVEGTSRLLQCGPRHAVVNTLLGIAKDVNEQHCEEHDS